MALVTYCIQGWASYDPWMRKQESETVESVYLCREIAFKELPKQGDVLEIAGHLYTVAGIRRIHKCFDNHSIITSEEIHIEGDSGLHWVGGGERGRQYVDKRKQELLTEGWEINARYEISRRP